MLIAVDLDDVLTDSAQRFIDFSNKTWGYDLRIDDYTEDWAGMWGVAPHVGERMSKQWHDSPDYHAPQADPKARQILEKLGRQHRLAIVTSRRNWAIEGTRAWVEEHFPDVFEDVHFAGVWDGPMRDKVNATKAAALKRIGARVLIDDQPKHCVAAREVGAYAILYGDYHWNQQTADTRIQRCKDWSAIERHFTYAPS